MTRPMVVCGDCGAVVRREEDEKESARIARHKAVGACRPRLDPGPKPKEPKRKANIRTPMGGGWDA